LRASQGDAKRIANSCQLFLCCNFALLSQRRIAVAEERHAAHIQGCDGIALQVIAEQQLQAFKDKCNRFIELAKSLYTKHRH
jgi:hypothetical protein